MIAKALTALGLGPTSIRILVVAAFALAGGLLTAAFPSSPFLPPVAAFLTACAALIDPNAHPAA